MMDDFTFTDLTITESTKMSDVVAADVEDIPVDDPVVKYTICQQGAVNSTEPNPCLFQTPKKHAVNQLTMPNSKSSWSLQTTPNNYFSPGGDSRFNDSLSDLLGSTPSPFTKNPFVSNFQVDIANKCKESDSLPEFIANECKESDSMPEFTANECRESESLPEFIANECKETDSLPELMLITTTKQPCQDVFYREQQLQLNFKLLHKRFPDNIKQLSRFYRHQAAIIETDRFRHLHPTNYPDHYRKTVNNHYDNQLHQTINSMEKILLSQLEESRQMKPDENQQWR